MQKQQKIILSSELHVAGLQQIRPICKTLKTNAVLSEHGLSLQ